jgi:hypothetical protein
MSENLADQLFSIKFNEKKSCNIVIKHMNSNFSQSLAFGSEGEHIIGGLLMSQSFYVLPHYQFANTDVVPKFLSISGSLSSPDMFVVKGGQLNYVECKVKRRWVRWDGKLETGIDRDDYNSYLTSSRDTGVPCRVFFIHIKQEPKGIFMVNVDNPNTRSWTGYSPDNSKIQKPMVFWPVEELKQLTVNNFDELTKDLVEF